MNIHHQDCQLQAASDSVSCEQFALGQNLHTQYVYTQHLFILFIWFDAITAYKQIIPRRTTH